MPKYTLICKKCQNKWVENSKSINNKQDFKCKKCGSKEYTKVFKPIGIILKGEGYTTGSSKGD